ncbi:hypothetical protein ACFWR9_29670 [Streptomyces sp. NPDC058534]|uniref:hypothetical protein n=1 Tax=Streptomyces sp. NPDC058534 TaxID=3346541 RepID=UPI0036609061
MKSLKVATVLVGSLIAAGAAAPAFADSAGGALPISGDRMVPVQSATVLDQKLPTEMVAIGQDNPLFTGVKDAATALDNSDSQRSAPSRRG